MTTAINTKIRLGDIMATSPGKFNLLHKSALKCAILIALLQTRSIAFLDSKANTYKPIILLYFLATLILSLIDSQRSWPIWSQNTMSQRGVTVRVVSSFADLIIIQRVG